MKKNKMMRIASVLLVAVLLSTCAISGTFAKYITEVSSSDSARVAQWGFNTARITIDNLFEDGYTNVATGTSEKGIIAPGTSGSATFVFENNATNKPEVAYTFTVSTGESACADAIKNSNITWALVTSDKVSTAKEDGEFSTWDDLIAEIEALDGDEEYGVGELPTMINTEYTILWNWEFDNSDDGNDNDNYNDSDLGNTAATTELLAKLEIIITATQKG